LPAFGALPTPNFLQQPIPMDLNPLIIDTKPSAESKCKQSTVNQKHGVKRSHETPPLDKLKAADNNAIPLLPKSNDLFSLFNPLTVTSSSADPDLLSSKITNSLSSSDIGAAL
jgi:hypothetical protein